MAFLRSVLTATNERSVPCDESCAAQIDLLLAMNTIALGHNSIQDQVSVMLPSSDQALLLQYISHQHSQPIHILCCIDNDSNLPVSTTNPLEPRRVMDFDVQG